MAESVKKWAKNFARGYRYGIMSLDIIRAEVRIGRPRDSMCGAHGILINIEGGSRERVAFCL